MKRALRLLVVVLLLVPLLARAETPESMLAEGRAEFEARRYTSALAIYQRLLRYQPRNPEALYTAGLSAYLSDDFASARQYWTSYIQVQPTDWRGLDKLIQAEQALGDQAHLKSHIAQLTSLYKAGKIPELQSERSFVRHQMRDAQNHVYAFQFFQPDYKQREHTYDFVVKDATSDKTRAMFYLMFDEAASGSGPKLWFFDVRAEGGRRSLATFGFEPTFEECVDLVRRVLAGEKIPRWQEKRPVQ